IDSELPIYAVRSMEESMAATVAQRRFAMRLLALFAAAALALSALGIYGVIAYGVSRRTREIGIRMALGARPRDVQGLILGQGLRLILAGVGLGVAGALAITRALSALLYGVSPRDPATFGAIAALLVAVALLATWLPARRAAALDPSAALRSEGGTLDDDRPGRPLRDPLAEAQPRIRGNRPRDVRPRHRRERRHLQCCGRRAVATASLPRRRPTRPVRRSLDAGRARQHRIRDLRGP